RRSWYSSSTEHRRPFSDRVRCAGLAGAALCTRSDGSARGGYRRRARSKSSGGDTHTCVAAVRPSYCTPPRGLDARPTSAGAPTALKRFPATNATVRHTTKTLQVAFLARRRRCSGQVEGKSRRIASPTPWRVQGSGVACPRSQRRLVQRGVVAHERGERQRT